MTRKEDDKLHCLPISPTCFILQAQVFNLICPPLQLCQAYSLAPWMRKGEPKPAPGYKGSSNLAMSFLSAKAKRQPGWLHSPFTQQV